MKVKWECNCLQDESGVMFSAITIALSWHDEYMNWTSIPQHNYYKKFSVNLPKSYIWAPSITVWNSAGAHTLLKLKNDSMLSVLSSGLVTTKISSILDTECELRLSRWCAFDTTYLLFGISLKILLIVTWAILLTVTYAEIGSHICNIQKIRLFGGVSKQRIPKQQVSIQRV